MPARPTGSLLVLKALATFEGSGLFDRLDPNADSQELRSLRLTCAELRQLVDCFGTKTLHIRLLNNDYLHLIRGSRRLGISGYAQLREAGTALGRYHARLTGPVQPHKLCISAKTCRTCPARDEHGDGGGGGDIVAAYMAGYMSAAGVPALLARVSECCLAGDYVFGPVHSGVWYALGPHLTSLEHLTLRFDGNHAPLAKARLLGMLPPSTQLRTLSIEEGEFVDREGWSYFLYLAENVLKEHPIQELHIMSRDALPNAKLLRALSDTLPSLERLHVKPRKPEFAMPAVRFEWLLPDNSFPTLRSISYQPYGDAPRPCVLLSELDELLRDRPRLLHVGALKVVLTAACLAKQARYEHVERAQSAGAADGSLGQLSFSLRLDDGKAAWAGMQLQELPITAGGGSGGQCTVTAWSSSGSHLVHIRRGMESALTRLAALLRPVQPPLPCAQKPPTEGLILTYM